MKTKRKTPSGRVYTRFGYCLHIILTVLGLTSFLLMIGFTGGCEQDLITLSEYVVRVIPCAIVFVASIEFHNIIFD